MSKPAERTPVIKRYAELTGRQRAFVDAYCVEFVAQRGDASHPVDLKRAYESAGYAGGTSASRSLLKRRLMPQIEERLAQLSEKAADKVVEILARVDTIALAEPEELAKWPDAKLRDVLTAATLALRARGKLVDVNEHRGAVNVVAYVPDNGRVSRDDAEG